jgi:hypothetical protein
MAVESSFPFDTPLKGLGFFRAVPLFDFYFPHPAELRTEWDPAEKEAVLHYLSAASVIDGWLEAIPVSVGSFRTDVPHWHHTDGVWLWHHSLCFYLAHGNVALPPAFLAHAAANRYEPPQLSLPEDPNLPPPHLPRLGDLGEYPADEPGLCPPVLLDSKSLVQSIPVADDPVTKRAHDSPLSLSPRCASASARVRSPS